MTQSPAPGARARTALPTAVTLRSRPLVVLIVIGLLALVGALVAAVWVQNRSAADGDLVEHTLEVEARVNALSALNEQIETSRRGYLLQGDDIYRRHFVDAAAQVGPLIARIDEMTNDNGSQQARLNALRNLSEQRRAHLANVVALVKSGRRRLAVRAFGNDDSTAITRRFRAIVDEMLHEEQALLRDRNIRQRETLTTLYIVLAITAALIIAIAASVLVILGRASKALHASNAELERLNSNLEAEIDARTGELQRANQEIQRFAYIVSHDLRSPLVNVMGFTAELETARKDIAAYFDTLFEEHPDLASQEARRAVEEDLPEALEFIRTSTAKMDRLINAILQLSRQGQRRLAPEELAMGTLVEDIADSLHQRASTAGATITIEELPDIVSDRLAIEQIFSNVMENAVKYLSPDRAGEVTVRGRVEGARAVYEIEDNGRGIDQRDHGRIFELFRRSGAQDQPGEGLGLAYVRALIYRLGGAVEVESELDRGTTFRLSLPLAISAS
ncbi:sensor histidine kinase [Stakelama saccharophila]|uniref:histidine kinase n=1 Tax=Stakelama saccharophila TaxID=3075605 RepID=A0ABZ0BC74_9SPHN|nr:ATP-binding protein [Stakelama sp. W311]WNO54958.1 CHASE3 domain-containing protein [Stakelama sp. W311]